MRPPEGSKPPLDRLRVLEIAGLGPGPFAGMLLADMGADVLRIDRPVPLDRKPPPELDLVNRGKRSAVIDLKSPEGGATVVRLAERAAVLIEGFRPGVAERLGFGPEVCLRRNGRLVYVRMTGWGREGPLAQMAGHDIDYIALTGPLEAIGRKGAPPSPPLNLVSDYGGGAVFAFGILCAVLEARSSGRGQVIDAAMIDATAVLSVHYHALLGAGVAQGPHGTNRLDSGWPWYDAYETADGKYVAVGALEPQFYAELVRLLGLDDLPDRGDASNWDEIRRRFGVTFRRRTRAEWEALFDGTDACVAPVLSFGEAPDHPQHRARGTYVEAFGSLMPSPAPRLERTPGRVASPPPRPGQHTAEALHDWGLPLEEIERLRECGAVR